MKRAALFIFYILIAQFLFAQNYTQTIRGTIVDKNSQMPLPGAAVVLINSNPLRGAVADSNGRFRLEKVPIGRAGIKISYIGYNDILLNNLELNAAHELILNIGMEERIYAGKEVVISAESDKSSSINRMAAVSARTFTIEESDKYAGARSDVARMASNFAGVTGNNDSRNDIVIRGNTPSGLLWRVDGVDIPNPNHFAGFGTTGGPISILRNNLLSNSDFITAAFPAEYGNAISGVFDLKMINGNDEHHEFMGQVAFNGIELSAEGPLNKKTAASYILNYRYSTLDVFSKMGIQLGTGQGIPKYQDVLFKINIPRTKIGSFTLFGFGGLSEISFLDSKKDTTKEKIDFYGSEGWDLTNFSNQAVTGLSHTYIINSSTYTKTIIAATYHGFRTLKDSVTPGLIAITPYQRSNLIECRLSASFFINKKFSARHNLRTGFEFSDISLNLNDSIYKKNVNRFTQKNDFSGFQYLLQPYVEWQFRLRENIVLNTGIHGQYLTNTQSWSAEPRISLKWNFMPTQSFGIGYGMHSQLATPTVFYNQVELIDGSYHRTNTNLDFIRSHHFAFSYDWSITENTRLKTELYYQYIYNVPVNKMQHDSYSLLNQGANFEVFSPDTLINSGSGRNYGAELTLERFMSRGFYYLGTVSLFESKYRGSDNVERNTAFNSNYIVNMLAGKEFNLKFRKKKEEKRKKSFTVNLKTTLSGGQRYSPINTDESMAAKKPVYIDELAYSKQFPYYNRTDLKLIYKMNGKRITVEWSLEITNIFNQKNVYTQTFNHKTGETYFTYQLGRMIIPQYRIIF
ncbi:MAG: TonB-dependent receptor [Bacteroidota bacterium]